MAPIEEISVKDTFTAFEKNPNIKLIDVREDDELAAIKTEVAEHVPLSRFEFENFEKRFGKNDAIYILCRSGGRSRRLAEVLAEHGYKNLYNVTGGIIAWQAAGLPTGAI